MKKAALTAALAAVMSSGTAAWAQDVDVIGTSFSGQYADLKIAAENINVNVGGNPAGNLAITIKRDQAVSSGPTAGPYWYLNGDDGSGNVTNFINVDITGDATGVTLSGSGAAAIDGPLMALINATGDITVTNLEIVDGRSNVNASGTLSGYSGGGLLVGGMSTDPFSAADTAPFNSLTLESLTFTNNKIDLIGGAAMGGGLSVFNIGGSGASQGAMTLTAVDFAGNQAILNSVAPSTDSAIGGGARILGVKNIVYDSGSVSNNQAQANNASHAHGGGLAIEGDQVAITIGREVSFSGNTAQVSGQSGNPNMVARGGGLYVAAEQLSNNDGSLLLSGTTFTQNQAVAEGANNVAIGGGVVIHGDIDATFGAEVLNPGGDNEQLFVTSFTDNAAIAANGAMDAMGGAVASLNNEASGASAGDMTFQGTEFTRNKASATANARGGAVYAAGNVLVQIGSFTGNEAISTGVNGTAAGGAMYLAQGGDIEPIGYAAPLFSGNKASATDSTGNASAKGGAIYLAGGTLNLNGVFGNYGAATGNTATSSTNGAAMGGAIYQEAGDLNINGSLFTGNQALAVGQNNSAMGGAVFNESGDLTVGEYTRFDGNSVQAKDGVAAGGAIYSAPGTGGDVVIDSNAVFTGNQAEATGASGRALGGALYLSGGSHELTNVSFMDNTAVAADAKGGAIFLDTSGGMADSNLTLVADGGTTAFRGNTANGQSSGIHIGQSNGSDHNAMLTIETNNDLSTMKMEDALSVAMTNGKNFTLVKTGAGTLEMDNVSRVSMGGNGQANLNFNEGTLTLGRNFSLLAEAGDLNVSFGGGTTVKFDSLRDKTQAFFGRDGSSGGSFTVGGGAGLTTLTVQDTTLHLVDYTDSFLFLNGGATSADNSELNKFNFDRHLENSKFIQVGNDIYLDYSYTSPYTAAWMAGGANTRRAIYSLNDLMPLLTADERLTVIDNFGAVTPEHGMVAGNMSLNVNQFMSRMAVRQGLRVEHQGSLPTPLSVQPAYGGANEGPRVWAGYAGNFRKVDNSGGYYGYDQDTSAAMLGVSYDLGPEATVGIFGGYSNNKADLNKISSEVESDGTHLGILARLTPMASVDPNLAIYLDAGYSRYENDAYRRLNSQKATSNYDQTAYTAGVGVEYAVAVDYEVLLTPSLDLRYTKMEQDSFREKGLTANYVKGYDANSFTSALALTASKEISIAGGTITPSARLGWNHEYGDTDVSTTARYINPSGGLMPTGYKLSAVKQNRDSMDAGVALNTLLNSGSYHEVGLNLSYDANISKNADTHSVYGGLEYRF